MWPSEKKERQFAELLGLPFPLRETNAALRFEYIIEANQGSPVTHSMLVYEGDSETHSEVASIEAHVGYYADHKNVMEVWFND